MGKTHINIRPAGSIHRHGGIARTNDPTFSGLLLRGGTAKRVLQGFERFLTDIYHQPSRLSDLLKLSDLDEEELDFFRQSDHLNRFLIRLCPTTREWMIQLIGHNITDTLIDHYGLYGDKPISASKIATNLNIGDGYAYILSTVIKEHVYRSNM